MIPLHRVRRAPRCKPPDLVERQHEAGEAEHRAVVMPWMRPVDVGADMPEFVEICDVCHQASPVPDARKPAPECGPRNEGKPSLRFTETIGGSQAALSNHVVLPARNIRSLVRRETNRRDKASVGRNRNLGCVQSCFRVDILATQQPADQLTEFSE